MSQSRFHAPAAAPGARIALPEHSAHHARDVLRLRAGMPVRVFDGAGNEFEAHLEEVSRNRVSLRVGQPVAAAPESPLRIVLAPAVLKGDGMDWIVQKAVELGVTELWPMVTARTDPASRPALRGTRHKRWSKVAAGAAEQCGRAVVPLVAATTGFEELLARRFEGLKLLLLERLSGPGLGRLPPPETAVLLAVGPPGGWEPRELQQAEAAGFALQGLGPRVLRSETAAIAALALAQALWGDLG